VRPSRILHGVPIICALAATPCVAQAQPANKPPVAASAAQVPARETGKDTSTPAPAAASLDDYAGIYEFPHSLALTIVVHDGQLYERFHDDAFLKIEVVGPDEFVVPEYLVYFSFQRTGGKVSGVVVNHANDSVGVKTTRPVPPAAFLSEVDRERYGGNHAFAGYVDGDASDGPGGQTGWSEMKVVVNKGQLFVEQLGRCFRPARVRQIDGRPDCFTYGDGVLCFESCRGGQTGGFQIRSPHMRHGGARFVRAETETAND